MHHDTPLISTIVAGLVLAYIFGMIANRLKLPPLVGYLFAGILVTMMIPFEIALIPNFLLIRSLGWYDTYAALIVPWAANAFSIFLIRQAMIGIPTDYYDAARMDGCGHLRFLVRVAAPMVNPMVATVVLFTRSE